MQKEFFKMRHAALAAAIALALGAPASFADEAEVHGAADIAPLVEPVPPVDVVAGDEGVTDPAGEPVVIDEPLPGDETAVGEEPAPGDDVVLDDPQPVDDGSMTVDDPVAIEDAGTVDEGGVVDEGTVEITSDVPVAEETEVLPTRGPGDDDCGMICWNTAIDPAVLRGNEAPDDKVLDKEVELDSNALDQGIAAQVDSAVGVAEQLGAASNESTVADSVIGTAEPALDVASAAPGTAVSVIRDGHLR